MAERLYQVCTNCVMDTTDPKIEFDNDGVCNRCRKFYRHVLPEWNYGYGKEKELKNIIEKIKSSGKGKEFDCLIGVSGGLDSSYLLHIAVKEFDLRPLVLHVDSGWDEPFAQENIKKIVRKLNLNLIIEKLNWEDMKNFQLAMFKAGVPDLDIPQDHAFVALVDRYALNYKIKYIINGGNISTEIASDPGGWLYWGTDILYIRDILKNHYRIKLNQYPFTNTFKRKFIIPYIKGIKTIKLLDHIPYFKNKAEKTLVEEYGWQPYLEKHYESTMTKFLEGYWLPTRFGYDIRKAQYSSLILTGQMTREEALNKLNKKPISDDEARRLFKYVAEKLNISEDELRTYLQMPLKSYKDYRNSWLFISLGEKLVRLLGSYKLIR